MPTDWERRFLAPIVGFFDWSPLAPERIVYSTDLTGIWQIHSWDRSSGKRLQVTDNPVGITTGFPTLDGKEVVWFEDDTGDESGLWLARPLEGGEPRRFVDGLPAGWNEGFAQAPGVIAASISDRAGFSIFVSIGGGPVKEIYSSVESVRIGGAESSGFNRGGLSADGSLLCLEHAEYSDLIHTALRVVEPRTGATIAEQLDDGLALSSASWSPVNGDNRLAIIHEVNGERQPATWDPVRNDRVELRLECDGPVEVVGWTNDAAELVLVHSYRGTYELMRYHIDSHVISSLKTGLGTISSARVRPNGSVWHLYSRAHLPPTAIDEKDEEVLAIEGANPPVGRQYESWFFKNSLDQEIHGFYVTPTGEPPWPTIMYVHGGPSWLISDEWNPQVQAYVDWGFAVGLVNYRGSTGYGHEWRDSLIGNVGGPELEDVNAGLADLISKGIADPNRAVVAGWSWGGYITLMELAKHPELWVCGMAGIPVGDYEVSYDDLSPSLAAYDRALLGGTPKDVPDLMKDRNPIYFVDQVRAPILIIAGENDSRCPIRQVNLYIDKLKERDHPHEVYMFPTGHGSLDVREEVRQMKTIEAFLARHVPPSRNDDNGDPKD
jgi:dienelactone hydrolase